MKIYFILSLFLLGIYAASANKEHQSRPQTKETTNEDSHTLEKNDTMHHERTNKMLPPEQQKHHKPKDGKYMHQKNNKYSSSSTKTFTREKRLKKLLKHKMKKSDNKKLHKPVVEYNLNKQQEDLKLDVQMEKEHLLHVTPRPPQVKKTENTKKRTKAGNKKTNNAIRRNKSKVRISDTASSSKGRKLKKNGKSKYPKKYNAKLHGWDKQKKNDRLKEKKEKQLKKMKAMHQTIFKNSKSL